MKTAKLNIANRTMFINDNLYVLNGMNDECVDLIYLDPPFNSNKSYAAPIGSAAEGSEFIDEWHLDDIDLAWLDVIRADNKILAEFLESVEGFGGKGDKAYLIFMARRLIEMKRILKDSGSIYLHCDPVMSHSLKIVMDCIFGKKNFRNEIVWCYRTGGAKRTSFSNKHDVILFYSKTSQHAFNLQKEKAYTKSKARKAGVIDYGGGDAEFFEDENGVYNLVHMRDVWDISYINSRSKERCGYPTQKPLELLERIVKASSNVGDVVFDPFCGCATALVAAERLERQWIGCDLSNKAVELIRQRLQAEELLWSQVGKGKNLIDRKDLPVRDDVGIITNMKEHKTELYGECGGYCVPCGAHLRKDQLEIDHILPRSKGGQDTRNNLQLLCGSCNRIKGNRTQEYLIARLKEVRP